LVESGNSTRKKGEKRLDGDRLLEGKGRIQTHPATAASSGKGSCEGQMGGGGFVGKGQNSGKSPKESPISLNKWEKGGRGGKSGIEKNK